MQIEQIRWKDEEKGWEVFNSQLDNHQKVQLVIVFGDRDLIQNDERYRELNSRYPSAQIIGGSTAGNILGASITDKDIVATAVYFEKSGIKIITSDIENPTDLESKSSEIVTRLKNEDNNLKHIFVLSDGIHFNGSELAKGINIQTDVSTTGGLVGDGDKFEETYVISDNNVKSKRVVFVGFYGENLCTSYGCCAGWGEFGVDRIITKSKGNVVYEIDGQPALKLYKKYLGDFADKLPASGLRFPLSIRQSENDYKLIRTLLSINEEQQSLTFAGDTPEGSITLLMKGNIDDLISSSEQAAQDAKLETGNTTLAIVISCVGRRLLMDQMADEELETAQEILGKNTWITGFYSYGELSPNNKDNKTCNLHNQTLTLMTISET